MTQITNETTSTSFDGRIAGVFNTITLALAGVLLFAAFIPV